MAVKLSVGLQQKIGQPDYGSLGASCHLEFEIDRSLLESDRDGFQEQVRSAFAACQQSVNEQLAQQSGHSSPQPGNGQSNGIPHHTRHTLHSTGGDVAGATKSQIRAIFLRLPRGLVVVKGEVTNRRRELDCGSEYADAHNGVKEN